MREILFRGKRKDNGEWVEGFYAKSGEKAYIIIDNSFAVGYVTMKEVALSTVGQYTGLTDKNGVRIFEGDILQFENDDGEFSLYSCEWGGEICGWVIRFLEYDVLCDALDALFCMDAQVIGNIHDNPELLKLARKEQSDD